MTPLEWGWEHRDSPDETWFFFSGLPWIARAAGATFVLCGVSVAAFDARKTAMDVVGGTILMVVVGWYFVRLARSGIHVSRNGVRVDYRGWATKIPWADVESFGADDAGIFLRRAGRQPLRLWDTFRIRLPGISMPRPDAFDLLVIDLNRSLVRWRPTEPEHAL